MKKTKLVEPTQTKDNTAPKKKTRAWEVTVKFVPFESDSRRDLSYATWIEALFPAVDGDS